MFGYVWYVGYVCVVCVVCVGMSSKVGKSYLLGMFGKLCTPSVGDIGDIDEEFLDRPRRLVKLCDLTQHVERTSCVT